jgi:hypothetical protein
MKRHGATIMGVTLCVMHPLKCDFLGTMHNALVNSRVKQLLQLLREDTQNVTALQQRTHVFWARQYF